jgi:hypothetical protein
MPDTAEVLEQGGLEFDDDLLGAEDISERETPEETGEIETPVVATPDPPWKQAGFSSAEDYATAVAADRDAKAEALRKYEEDKNIQAYTAQREQERQAAERARQEAAQADDREFNKFVEETGMPKQIAQGFRHLLNRERQAHGEALKRTIDYFQGQLQEATTPLKHIMDAVSIKQAPEPIQKVSEEAQAFLALADRAGLSPAEAKAYVGRNMLSAHEKWTGGKSATTTNAKPNLQVARKPRMESAESGTGPAPETSGKKEEELFRQWYREQN